MTGFSSAPETERMMSGDERSAASTTKVSEAARPATARPALTIGMPVYNGEKYIGAALRSLAAQTFGDYELVICDNASTDRTQAICEEHAARDPRIRYVRSETNRGVLANFDRAVELASCDLFMWAASDDLWEPRFAERMVGALRAEPDASLVYCDYNWVDDDEKVLRHGKTRFIANRPSPLDRVLTFNRDNARLHNLYLYFMWRNPFLVYGMFRTAALRRVLPFEYVFSDARHADNLFMLRFLMREKVTVVNEVLFHYRVKNRATAESTASYQSPTQSEPEAASKKEAEIERTLLRRVLAVIDEAPLTGVEAKVLRGTFPVLSRARCAALEYAERRAKRR